MKQDNRIRIMKIWKMHMNHHWLSSLLLLALTSPVEADEDLFSLPLEELSRMEVRIATGTPKPITEVPAIASVITADELKAMGAQDLDSALEMVPGLHVSHGGFIYASRYFMRGIVSTYNPHTLVLINGIPQTSLFTGDRGERLVAMTGLPVQMVERIEIIRGPGSAVYGADAFAGVINIITKRPEDMHGGQFTASYGSFNTPRASLQQATSLGPVKSLLSLSYSRSDGDSPLINTDSQSSLDALFGTSASYAPGPANLAWKNLDARSDMLWNDFRLRMSYRRSEGETAQGINESLDPGARFPHHRGSVDLTWHAPGLWQDWDIESQASYLYSDFRNPTGIRQFPPGAFGLFPDGVLQKPELSEENARFHLVALYRGMDHHQIRFGSGYYWGDIFKTTDSVNYQLLPGNPIPQPRPGGLQDVSDSPEAFLPENQRTSHHVFAQDEWQMATNWQLTTGVRYDHFSDFGGATNPRLAVVWNTTPNLTTKLLYGEAFRAPAFFELYATNNPVALGNPDLEPEKLKSMEAGFSWHPESSWTWDINFYHFHIHDFIDFVSDPGTSTFTARNTGRIEGTGVETEVRHQWSNRLQLLVNFSHQQTRDKTSNASLGLTPTEDASLRLIWEPVSRWQVTPQLVWVGETKRQAGDPRRPMDGYTTLDLTVRRVWPDGSISFVSRNLFDAYVQEASRGPETGAAVAIPGDLPQSGRSIALEASLRW